MTVETRELTALQRAVVEAVAYSDVFDFPVTAAEIRRALPFEASVSEVEEALTSGSALAGRIGVAGPYYVIAARESLAGLRERRAETSASLMRRAERYGSLIAKLPFVRMVAVTGSLAVDNADDGDDIDYLIVTAPGRVWLARALTMLAVRLALLRGLTLCPNYLLSESVLALPGRDVYTARELLQMRPVAGHGVYARMLAANAWCSDLLPNWRVDAEAMTPPRAAVARLGERWLGGRLGDAMERWLLRRKGGELRARAGGGSEAVFDETQCKGHFDAHGARLRQALSSRLRRLGVEP